MRRDIQLTLPCPVPRELLLYCLLLEAILLAGFVLNRGWMPRVTAMKVAATPQNYSPNLDPPLRQTPPALFVSNAGGAMIDLSRSRSGRHLIAFFSGCADCSLPYLQKLQATRPQAHGFRVSVIFPELSPTIAEFLRSHAIRLDFYSLQDQGVLASYNVAWHPRLFLVDEQGELLYAQPPTDRFEAALHNAMVIR